MEAKRPTGDFNITATPSPEMWRKLAYLAAMGSEVMATPFAAVVNGETPREKQRREDREAFERFVGTLASRERIEGFTKELNRLDEASTAALIENERKLTVAREELKKIRERAYELTRPDGTTTKVYREGESVRDDDGAVVDPLLIKPEDIPSSAPTWAERHGAGTHVQSLETTRQNILNYREALGDAEKRVSAGGITEEDLSELEANLAQKMPDEVRGHLTTGTKLDGSGALDRAATFDSDVRPTPSFGSVAWGAITRPATEVPVTPRGPTASRPAPK